MKSLKEFKVNEIKKRKQSKVNSAWGFDMYPTRYEQATAEEIGSLPIYGPDTHYDTNEDGDIQKHEFVNEH